MKTYRIAFTAILLALTLTFAAVPPPVRAGIIISGDGVMCDTETGACCDPKKQDCEAFFNGQGSQSVEPSLLERLSAAIASLTNGIIISGD